MKQGQGNRIEQQIAMQVDSYNGIVGRSSREGKKGTERKAMVATRPDIQEMTPTKNRMDTALHHILTTGLIVSSPNESSEESLSLLPPLHLPSPATLTLTSSTSTPPSPKEEGAGIINLLFLASK